MTVPSPVTTPEELPAGFSRRQATVNGTGVSFLVGGSGEPLVLLHGWPQTALAWRRILQPLAERGYRVIVPDLRGLGASDRASSGYDKDSQADDVRALLDHLGIEGKVGLVGHDLGGMVAFAYARKHPAEVDRLVLMELALPGFGLEEAMDVAHGGRWHFGLFMAADVPELLFAGHEREFFQWWFAHLSADPGQFSTTEIDEVVRAYSGRQSLVCGFNHYRTLLDDGRANRAWHEAGGRLSMPVLAVGGSAGVGSRLADSLHAVAPELTAAVVDGSGHFVAEERPDEVVQLLAGFLSSSR